jgi:hypothetical protein
MAMPTGRSDKRITKEMVVELVRPVRTFMRQRRPGVKSLFPETTEIGRVRNGGLRAAVCLCNVEWVGTGTSQENCLIPGRFFS